MVTKLPLRAFFPLPNRVRPKFRAVTVEAHLSEPQASKRPLNQTGEIDKQQVPLCVQVVSAFKIMTSLVIDCLTCQNAKVHNNGLLIIIPHTGVEWDFQIFIRTVDLQCVLWVIRSPPLDWPIFLERVLLLNFVNAFSLL